MRTLNVCLSPDLLHLYPLEGKIVVVVDILRATSCMVTGLAHGIQSITPFESLELCQAKKKEDYIIAGERNGQKVEGFDLGNSPFDYMDENLKGKKVAITTTNGTVAIERSKPAHQVIVGAFLNLMAVKDYLKSQEQDVLILCAGWKGQVNLEDSLFAGALAESLKDDFCAGDDSTLAMQTLYCCVKDDLPGHLENSSHVQRLKRLNIKQDIEFCLTRDCYTNIPALDGIELVDISLATLLK